MKTIFISGSRKFYPEIAQLIEQLNLNNVSAISTIKPRTKDELETERAVMLSGFQMIDASDFIYVFAKDGYIGNAVSMEMAYAHARGKSIVASETIAELSAHALVNTVQTVEELLQSYAQ